MKKLSLVLGIGLGLVLLFLTTGKDEDEEPLEIIEVFHPVLGAVKMAQAIAEMYREEGCESLAEMGAPFLSQDVSRHMLGGQKDD